MNKKDTNIDLSVHVMYSKECREEIIKYIKKHYPATKVGSVFNAVDEKYAEFLKDFRTDLGGKKNFHNGLGGTYDCIAVFSYYLVCRDKTTLQEIEELYGNIFTKPFERLGFIDVNKTFWKRILYMVFSSSAKQCGRWKDFVMNLQPFSASEPIRYTFTKCPVAEFAKEHDLLEVLPYLCNVDFAAMEPLHARLVRTTTLGFGDVCDYTICGDKDDYLKSHEQYVDENGYIRNK